MAKMIHCTHIFHRLACRGSLTMMSSRMLIEIIWTVWFNYNFSLFLFLTPKHSCTRWLKTENGPLLKNCFLEWLKTQKGLFNFKTTDEMWSLKFEQVKECTKQKRPETRLLWQIFSLGRVQILVQDESMPETKLIQKPWALSSMPECCFAVWGNKQRMR